jgi:hypothetical protein
MAYADFLSPPSRSSNARHIPCSGLVSSYRPEPLQLQISGEKAASHASASGAQPPPRGEAAGLVSFKTKANEGSTARPPIEANDEIIISFGKEAVAEKRCKNLRMMVWASGHLHGLAKNGHRPMVPYFVTLTYALADAWQPNHIKRAVDAFRRWCARQGLPAKYTWVAEIQPKRLETTGKAVVHYHLMIWLPLGVKMPKWDVPRVMASGRVREAFWGHGMTNTQQAKAGIGYLMKYLSKLGELTVFPEGLRLYGIGGLDAQARAVRAWYGLPGWVRRTYGVGDVRRVGRSLVDLATGEVLPPMWSRNFVPGGMLLTCLRDYPKPWADGAFSTFPRTTA